MGLGSGIRDPGSRIRKKPIPDPGVKGTGSRIRIRNTGWVDKQARVWHYLRAVSRAVAFSDQHSFMSLVITRND
jgi:hypothetical protein